MYQSYRAIGKHIIYIPLFFVIYGISIAILLISDRNLITLSLYALCGNMLISVNLNEMNFTLEEI